MLLNLDQYVHESVLKIQQARTARSEGFIDQVLINTVYAVLPGIFIGEICRIYPDNRQSRYVLGEVVAFEGQRAVIACLEDPKGLAYGALVVPTGQVHALKIKPGVFGQVLDGFGRSLEYPTHEDKGVMSVDIDAYKVMSEAPLAVNRPPIDGIFTTGIRVIDGLNTFGEGQRIGVFAPPGCGKSTLMAHIARGCHADVVVFGLVGERGRELREFIDNEITDELRAKTIFVCATSDRTPIERVRASFTATALAEVFRAQGKRVLLLIDSLTRLARAQREIGLSVGEPATSSGLTPSVYQLLPTLIERSGRTQEGSITAVYTVLLEKATIEGDPIASECKSLLDAHLLLSNKLVARSHFPAIDVLSSLSRVMNNLIDKRHAHLASRLRLALSNYQDAELLIRINEYHKGQDLITDFAIDNKARIDKWLMQSRDEYVSQEASLSELSKILESFP